MKQCNLCKQDKLVSEFYKGKARCKSCYNEVSKAYNRANRQRLNAIQRAYYYRKRGMIELPPLDVWADYFSIMNQIKKNEVA